MFEAERPQLVPYVAPFDGFHSVSASVSKTCTVRFDNKYSVMATAVGRPVDVKLGPAANSMERLEKLAAARDGRDYVPVTERGAVVHAARQARVAFRDMRERLDVAREDLWGRTGSGRFPGEAGADCRA